MTIGPSLPPSATPSQPASDSDSDDYSPALPPDLVNKSSAPKPILGPTLPPSFSLPTPSTSTSTAAPPKRETPLSNLYSDDDDDDDDFGPQPLPDGYKVVENDGVSFFREREEREREEKRRKEEEGNGKLKREEWMLVPPKEVNMLQSMDPTKLKSRSFQQASKESQSGSRTKDAGPNLWTETPAERKQRLEDELLGKKGKAEISAAGGGIKEEESDDKRRKRERDWKLREEVERHNKAARSTTLLDAHSKVKKSEAKDGPAPGIWDRDRDMSVGGRLMDDGKRADIVKSAKELGGRFGGGSYL